MPSPLLNASVLQRFLRLRRSGRLAHAYLLTGPAGSGKLTTAMAVARLIVCEAPDAGGAPCDRVCSACRRVDSGNYPDVVLLKSEDGRTIKIAGVRELINRMPLRPFEAACKVFIIRNIEELTLEGANALLKTLEEPANNTLLILTSSVPEKTLETIRSRCHQIPFLPASTGQVAAALMAECSLSEEEARFLSGFSRGCLTLARRGHEEGLLERKNEIIDNVILRRNNESYLKTLLADKDRLREALDVLLTWFRDVLLIKSGAGEEWCMHADRLADLRRSSARYSAGQIDGILFRITDAFRLLGENLNVKIPMQLVLCRFDS